MIGKTLAHYEVTGKLGEGGMGEVFRAHDQKLQRDVAIKLLPQEMSQDPERLARFDREARALATLQHPNVASAYGLEQTPEARFLVMELVEGEGLDERMARGPVPPDEVRRLATQIACGLEAAHEKGIVHRDLKPANIRVAPDGTVKVLDFGLAKAWSGDDQESDLSNSPTMTVHTIQGVIMGTAGYMSPEQALGQAVNKQTDIWAFGVILWEMLTGQRLFEGTTASDIMAGVLRADINDRPLPDSTPAPIRRLLRRCLERDPKQRLRDIGDAALELAEIESGENSDEGNWQRPAAGRLTLPAWLAILAVAVLGTGFATRYFSGPATSGPAAASIPYFEPKTFGEQVIFNAGFLPDDQGIVFSSAPFGNIPSLQYLASAGAAPRTIGPSATTLLSVSDTGELAVLTNAKYLSHRVLQGTLASMRLDGSPRPLIENARDADWGPNGELAIVRRVGGVDRLEYPIDNVLYETSGYISEPRVSPDGQQVAFLDHQWWLDDRGWLKLADAEGEVTTLSDEQWAIQGVVWTRDGSQILFSGADDGSKLAPMVINLSDAQARPFLGTSSATTILDLDGQDRLLALGNNNETYGIMVHPGGSAADIDVTWMDLCWGAVMADDKTAVFTYGRGGNNYTVMSRTTDGSPPITLGPGDFQGVSPDGAWVTAQFATPPGVSVYPTGAGTARQLDPGPIAQFHRTFWYPDSEHILIVGNVEGGPARCYRQAISGGAPEPVTIADAERFSLLTLDGKAVLGQDQDLNWSLYPLDGASPRAMPGLHAGDEALAWDPTGTAVFVSEQRQVPWTLIRVDLATQERRPDATIGPEREPGLQRLTIFGTVFDPESSYAFGYFKRLSRLFVVENAGW